MAQMAVDLREEGLLVDWISQITALDAWAAWSLCYEGKMPMAKGSGYDNQVINSKELL